MPSPSPLGPRLTTLIGSSLVAGLALLGPGLAQAEKGKKHALLVGVREYDSSKFDTLKCTENDAEELARVLREQAGFTVRVLTSARGVKRKTDAPTAANLRAEIKALLAGKKRDDTVLVALAGHGMQAQVKEAGKDADESFFCPSDAQFSDTRTLLSLSRLVRDLDGCGAGVKLLLVDACRNEPGLGRNANLDNLRPPRGLAALFSCKSGERAFETDKLGKGHGVFFHHVIEGLKGEAKNKRGEVTWSRLAEYVTESVSEDVPRLIGGGAKQTPEQKLNITGRSPVLIAPAKKMVVKDWSKEVTNSIGMKLMRIPRGTFTMGSPAGEKDRRPDEEQHEVEITKDFWLGIHAVTQKQYKDVMGFNPSYFSPDGAGKPGEEHKYSRPAGGKSSVSGKDTGDFPVENVSWDDALDFCRKLSALAVETNRGRMYRLPTEAEWEYACRAATATAYHFGDSISDAQANYRGAGPVKVGSYRPNAFGLFDMHGNIQQWCSDRYSADYYKKSSKKDPEGATKGEYGNSRVLRGGSWNGDAAISRAARRNYMGHDFRYYSIGFRVVCVPASR
jgi:formylglycine-generating enzyme required for sulfatase activity